MKNDIKFAFPRLLKNPGFTAVVVLSRRTLADKTQELETMKANPAKS